MLKNIGKKIFTILRSNFCLSKPVVKLYFSRFTINSVSGEISTTRSLDYESQSQYILIVEAIDSPIDRLTGTATVTVNVIDVQDSIPIFTQVSISTSVNENANLGSVVTSVTVSIVFFRTKIW